MRWSLPLPHSGHRAPLLGIVHRDDVCTAFMDIQPVVAGHTLIIPNDHATYLADLPEAAGAHIFRLAQRIAASLRQSALRCEGVNLWLCGGRVAMQDVMHVHLHVIPRYRGDGFGLRVPPSYGQRPPRAELDALAGMLRDMLALGSTEG